MNLSAVGAGTEASLIALDGIRGRLLRFSLGVRGLRAVVARRDARLVVQSVLSVTLLGVATLLVPGVLLVLGPVLFGVAHVTGDFRHLVIRRKLPQAWTRVVAVASVALIALRIAELLAPSALAYAGLQSESR